MTVALKPARTSVQRRNYGRGHGYKIDGKKVPGVTTIISDTVPKPALVGWAARMVAEMVADAGIDDLEVWRRMGRDELVAALTARPRSTTSQAAVRGTDVHRLADRIVHGEEIEDSPEVEHLWGHAESCVKFMNDWRVAPVLTEAVVAHKRLRYAGTLDLVADLPDGRRVLFDYKTSKGVWAEQALQLAGYRWAEVYLTPDGDEQPMADLGISAAYVVHLRADDYDVYPVQTVGEVRQLFEFLAQAWHLLQGKENWVGDVEAWAA